MKTLKIILLSIVSLILIGSLSFAFLLSTNKGHLVSAKILSEFLSSRLKTRVTIDSLYFSSSRLNLKNIRIYDYKNNIFLSVEDAKAYINKFKVPYNMDFEQLEINNGILNIALYDEKGAFNIQLILNELQSKDKSKKKKPTKLLFRKAYLHNIAFTYSRPDRKKNRGKINYDKLVVAGINGMVNNFLLYDGRVSLHAENLKCTEKSGLRVNNLTTDFRIDTTTIEFKNFFAITNQSKLKGSYVMTYNGYPAFRNFEKYVHLDAQLDNSIISLNDLNFFGKAIKTNEKYLKITGKATGTLDNLKSNHVQIFFGKESYYSGSFKLRGLPELTETFLDLKLKNSVISFRDITQLVPSAQFPDYFYNMGNIRVSGAYTGFANDFVANGFFKTKNGNIETDINFKIKPDKNLTEYSGNLKLDNFDLGSFMQLKKYFGPISMNGSISGKGLTLDNAKADIDVSISSMFFNNYNYQNIKYKGFIAKKTVDGTLTIRDPNVDLNFQGTIDLSQPKPIFRYIASLKNTNFQTLHLSKNPMTLNCDMDIKLTANNIDDVEGNIIVMHPEIILGNKTHSFEKIEITSQLLAGLKRISLRSDIATAEISGNYTLKTIPQLFQSAFFNYFDSSFSRKISKTYPDNFVDFSVHVIKSDFLNALIQINLSIDDGLKINGTLNNKRNYITLSGKIPGFRYKTFYLQGIDLGIDNNNSKTLSVDFKCNNIFNKDSLLANNIDLKSKTNSDILDYALSLKNRKLKTNLNINGQVALKRDSAEISVKNSKLIANNIEWNLTAKKIMVLFKPEIRIPLIELDHGKQSIKLTGIISKNNPDPIRILLDDVTLGDITYYLKNFSTNWGGTINGQVVIYDLLSKPYFDAGMVINPFVYKGTDTIGILSATSNHNAYTNQTFVQGTLEDKNLEPMINVDGYVDLVDKKVMDLKFDLQETDIEHFGFFVRGVFSDLKGKVSGKMNMFGSVKNPKVEGTADMSKVYFTVDYLKTTYHFDQKVKIDEKNVWIKDATLFDMYNNPVSVNGVIKHKLFSDYYFDLKLLGNSSFLGLNTTETDNSFYYGTAFASGNVHIFGPMQSVHMDLQIKSEKNTKIFMTTYNTSLSGQYRMIRFTSKTNKPATKQTEAPKGLTLNIDMDITPDADIELIMNPELNDLIKGNGYGNIKFELDYFGNMNMYGNYFINDGEYYFTALDVIKRKFKVNPNSKISWKGDPFDAVVNIDAIYPVDASLYDLFSGDNISDEDKQAYRQIIPVKVKIALTESLFSPAVKLDFDVLNTRTVSGNNDIILEKKLQYIKNDEQELNKQVISLLVINRFLPVSTGIVSGSTATEGLSANVGSLISSQVTRWISQLSGSLIPKYLEDFQIGVNYNANTTKYQRQLELAMSTSLFNDRVNISGSYDVENITGNFEVNYKLKKNNNNVRLKVFTRSDNNPIYQESINRQGIGILFRKDYNKFSELLKKEKPASTVKK